MEYRYDIYGLSENRDVDTIEAFLRHFTNRNLAKDRINKVITLIPDIPNSEKDKLFKPIYAYANGSPRRSAPNLANGLSSLTEPETVQVDTLSQAVELGVARKNVAFSLYIPAYTQANVNCLIVHFTFDNQVVLGLMISDRKDYDRFSSIRARNGMGDNPEEKNMLLAQKIRNELAEVILFKATAITFERPAPDNEQEFMGLKTFYESMDDFTKGFFRRKSLGTSDYQDGYYYSKYRHQLHRHCGHLNQEDRSGLNLFDNFSVGSKQEVLSVIKSEGDILSRRRVSNPEWKDVVKLPYLNYLLKEAISGTSDKFQLSAIHRVSIPPKAKAEPIWIGHRDGASDFTNFEGVKAAEVAIEETFCLDKIEDLKKLVAEGFFKSYDTFFLKPIADGYEAWLRKFGHTELFLTLQREPGVRWRPNVSSLLSLEGKHNWPKFLSSLQQCRPSNNELKDLLKVMCTSSSWETWQVNDILQKVSLNQPELEALLDTIAHYYQFELFDLLYTKKQVPSSLPHLVKQIKAAFNNRKSPEEAAKFINLYRQDIEKAYGPFCDYPLILTLAATEAYKKLLYRVLKLLPEKDRHSKELLNIALATDNRFMLRKLAFRPDQIENVRLEELALVQDMSEDVVPLIKKATEAGRYFQVAYLAPQLSPDQLLTPMLRASLTGMLGMVKVFVEQGKVAPDCWDNYPVKCANKGGFQKLKQYLLSKGAKNAVFR